MPAEPFLSVKGPQIVDAAGERVLLRGYNVGGWMNMENFLTGFPATESLHRNALRRTLGNERYDLFFKRFMNSFFAEPDVAHLASLGMNCVRLPINYHHFEDDDRPFELKDEGFRLVDRAVAMCRKYGIYCILDLHAVPGGQNQHWHSDNSTHWAQFWTHRDLQDRMIHLWEALADRYKDEPWVGGYNVLNEPADPTGDAVRAFYRRAKDAIRAVDPDHILFFDANCYSTDFTGFDPEPWPNTVYSLHDYKLPGFVYGGPYPGTTRGKYVDRAEIERNFLSRAQFCLRTQTPIWIGEFGPVFTGDEKLDEQKYRLLADQLQIYDEYGAGWALWGYKDIGGQGLVFASPDSPWRRRIQPMTEKKARLGVDHWGSTDHGIRHILEPIEQTFEREFPTFDPFPFGRQEWMEILVRHILLAEPLVDEFAALFADVHDDATIIALADSFAFDNCEQRRPLAELIAKATGRSAATRPA
jgi:endoglucanase